MKTFLDRFILGFPTLFLKQYPYAWIAVVLLWKWPPILSATFLVIVVVGIFAVVWRAKAWVSEMQREHAPGDATFYVDRLPIPIPFMARNLGILVALSALVAWFLQGQIGLTFWQLIIMFVGFSIFYMDTRFFGASTIYIVTGEGIAIYYIPGHIDYRIFIKFKEMRQIVRLESVEKIPETWTLFSRLRTTKRGILLVPRDRNGFSKRLQELLLTPTDTDEFIKHVPSTLVTDHL
jgi:hypothetical protein